MPAVRSLLFMPGGRADMIAKIPRFAPDTAVVDLEDAVAPAEKDAARAIAARAVDELGDTGRTTVLVRVNPPGTPAFADDVAAAAGCAASGIVVPKLGSLEQLTQVQDALASHDWSDAIMVGGIEDALGVADARQVAAGGLSAVYFGAEDYAADLGGRRTSRGDEVLYARSRVVLAAHLAGIPAIDQAVVGIGDDEQFQRDADAGVALGYQGKICLHPRQVELAHLAFTPTADEVAHARAVVVAAQRGVGVVDGQMVDDVHLRMALGVIARSET
ncbi:MAG: citryl-CoA lyase [Nocardioidaceae bacterium]|nr:citryl-CoA lyase [Nocardioidaceae bacterium]